MHDLIIVFSLVLQRCKVSQRLRESGNIKQQQIYFLTLEALYRSSRACSVITQNTSRWRNQYKMATSHKQPPHVETQNTIQIGAIVILQVTINCRISSVLINCCKS